MSQTKVEAPFVENNIPFRNIIINGAMQVAQRSTSVTGIGASAGYFTLDRFDMYFQNTAGRLTMSQTAVTDLPGFTQCLKLDCTTADTSIAAAENAVLQYQVEGQHLQHLKKGTSSAEKTTLSFYVKGDQAATYTCELADKDNSRQNTQTFSVTTSWNRVVLVFDGDTTGTYDNDNAKSLAIQIHLQAGSNSTSGTFTSNTWAANTDANTVKSDQTQFFDSTDRELFITGFQYEVGDAATDFEHLPFDVQFTRCCRYYWKPVQGNASTSEYVGLGDFYASNQVDTDFRHITPMRTQPTLDQGTGTDYYKYYYGQTADGTVDGSWTYWLGNEHISSIYATASDAVGTSNAGKACRIIAQTTGGTSAYLALSAEL